MRSSLRVKTVNISELCIIKKKFRKYLSEGSSNFKKWSYAVFYFTMLNINLCISHIAKIKKERSL